MIGVIFSCDRAMQLDATLRSFFLHCQDQNNIRLFVIYRATDPAHQYQYKTLRNEYEKNFPVVFLVEKNFRCDLLNLLYEKASASNFKWLFRFLTCLDHRFRFFGHLLLYPLKEEIVLFIVDDNLFIKDFSLRQINNMLVNHPDAVGFSLRLGINTTYCYPLDIRQNIPSMNYLSNDILMFNWTNSEGDFGVPFEISSSIYRIKDLLPHINDIIFHNPNTLEAQLARRAEIYRKLKPNLFCFVNSVAFCNPVNVVQTEYENRAGERISYTKDSLSELFEKGYRIDINAYNGFSPNACHQETELLFKKIEES
jgi:hypothetical protein